MQEPSSRTVGNRQIGVPDSFDLRRDPGEVFPDLKENVLYVIVLERQVANVVSSISGVDDRPDKM